MYGHAACGSRDVRFRPRARNHQTLLPLLGVGSGDETTGSHMSSLVPRPHPSAREKGLVTIARFLVCADSAICVLVM